MTEYQGDTGINTFYFFFIGILIMCFMVVGVNTFYPRPDPFDEIERLDQEEQSKQGSSTSDDFSRDELPGSEQINQRREESKESVLSSMAKWQRNTGLILLILATGTIGLSLIVSERIKPISPGILLGGTFTMIYGVVWSIVMNVGIIRFLTVTVSLVIGIIFGFRVILLSQDDTADSEEVTVIEAEDLSGLERRLRNLERRIVQAANVLGHKS
jgi:hypothetical protein